MVNIIGKAKKVLKRPYNFFIVRHFWFFLFIVVSISFSQILRMGVWKDDNAIFFKLQHIEEPAGFFGKGLLGEGPYKFSATPYYPIYKVFGEDNFLPYYVLIFISYYVSTLSIYLLFSKLGTKTLGKIASFLFASGYVASEGFYWISNAMFSNLAVISTSLILILYYLYLSKKKFYHFILSIFFFWLSIYFYPLRVYQVAIIIVAFELFFGLAVKGIKSLPVSILRLSPFMVIYYLFFLRDVDSRAALAKDFIIALSKGRFDNLYSFFSGISSLAFPNKYFDILWNHRFFGINIIPENKFIVTLGVVIFLLLAALYFFLGQKLRRLYLFCLVWLSINLAIYSVYDPKAFFGTTHRYLTNSFFSLAGIFGIIYVDFSQRKIQGAKLIAVLIILWGVGNIYNSYQYLSQINSQRSIPVANFYKQLKSYFPDINKGDVLYFDVNQNAQSYFSGAFSVSSMPETTALAWRYKVDRYDFDMFTDFSELTAFLAKDPKIGSLHTFYYDKGGLVDTTLKARELLTNGSVFVSNQKIEEMAPLTDMLLVFDGKVSLDFGKIEKLYIEGTNLFNTNTDMEHQNKLIAYLTARKSYYQKVKMESSSEWKYQELENVIDNNLETSWRGHRIWWHDNKNEKLAIDLGEIKDINRFIWVNLQRNTSPTSYSISASSDKIHWQKVVDKNSVPARKDGEKVEETFPPVKARFLLFDIKETLTDDSPAVSEVEVVDSEFSDINISEAFIFIQDPLKKVKNVQEARAILDLVAPWLNLAVNIRTDKESYSISLPLGAKLNEKRTFTTYLPAGGTKLVSINVDVPNLPLTLEVSQLRLRNVSLRDIQNSGFIKRFSQN